MKNSNKLLVGGFLTVLLLITAIHVSLYAKYKSGDYTLYTEEDDLASHPMQAFPNILFVSVQNVSGATVKFSDVARVEKSSETDVAFLQKGDTLLITGKNNNNEGIGHPVTFNLPYNATLSVDNSSLSFMPGKKTGENNPVFLLKKSRVIFSGREGQFPLGHVKLVASDSSLVLFQGNTQVNHLELQLAKSHIEYGEGDLGQLSIQTDSLSRISLSSKHLVKANIRTTSSQ